MHSKHSSALVIGLSQDFCNMDRALRLAPRGAALYILRPGDIPEGQSADSCYSRGICVY